MSQEKNTIKIWEKILKEDHAEGFSNITDKTWEEIYESGNLDFLRSIAKDPSRERLMRTSALDSYCNAILQNHPELKSQAIEILLSFVTDLDTPEDLRLASYQWLVDFKVTRIENTDLKDFILRDPGENDGFQLFKKILQWDKEN